ncbi:hypothetical protein YC2023_100706 [Brassica napus]
MALMAVVLKPDDAETEEIFGATMARAAAAALQSETPSVYHLPRRSSSFAGNSSPLPPSTVVLVANLCEMVKKLQSRLAFFNFQFVSLFGFVVGVGVTIGFLIVFAIICYRGVFAMKRRTDPRVARLIENISDLNTLQAMALMAVVLKHDDAETEEIFGAAMARAAAAALQSETPSVYHSPRRSSSFAGNSSPLPPSTVVLVANLCEMVKKLQV